MSTILSSKWVLLFHPLKFVILYYMRKCMIQTKWLTTFMDLKPPKNVEVKNLVTKIKNQPLIFQCTFLSAIDLLTIEDIISFKVAIFFFHAKLISNRLIWKHIWIYLYTKHGLFTYLFINVLTVADPIFIHYDIIS